MADREYCSWRQHKPQILGGVLKQHIDVCWSIAPTRQLDSILKLGDLLHLDSALSIQEFIDTMPRARFDHQGFLIVKIQVLFAASKHFSIDLSRHHRRGITRSKSFSLALGSPTLLVILHSSCFGLVITLSTFSSISMIS